MKKTMLMLALLIIASTGSAQSVFPKKEIKKATKLLQKASRRAPLPRLMLDDRSCINELYDLPKWDSQLSLLKADSIKRRHQENLFIKDRIASIDSAKISAKMAYAIQLIDREELRYDLYERERRKMTNNKVAEARTAPQGELISVSYNNIGMRHHPDLPFTISKLSNDSARVTFSFREARFNIDRKYLDEFNKIIIDNQLYKLHSSYDFNSWELPDYPRMIVLDGQRWSFTARYSDGTVISSSGRVGPEQNIGKISAYFFETIMPLRPTKKSKEDQ